MKSNPIIYTDEDVRPDLLTAEERAGFPETLDNWDRRQILRITRPRMDNIDYDGHHILPPKAWSNFYSDCLKRGTVQKIPEFRQTISREVVLPQNGEVRKVDAGIADIVQRLMDRGLVIDTVSSYSGMVTDHPGERWVNEVPQQGLIGMLKTGEHINDGFDGKGLSLVFPTDTQRKYHNDEQMAELIMRYAQQSGLAIERLPGQIEVQMPYLMDGTSRRDFLKEAREQAQAHFKARGGFQGDYMEWAKIMQMTKNLVAMHPEHGGPALFSDQMIHDRLSRFVRSLERSLIENRMVNRKETEQVCYGDFLTGSQRKDIYSRSAAYEQELWQRRALPYVYEKYNEAPHKVDEVAYQAGYKDYVQYLSDREKSAGSNKRWAAFQQLEKEHLTNNQEGLLKNFRINNGIQNELRNYENGLERQMASAVMERYHAYGYPIRQINEVHILMNEDGTAKVYADHRGQGMMKTVDRDEIARLMVNATTPFEMAMTAFAKEIGWQGKPNIDISRDTSKILDLEAKDRSGWMPLSVTGHTYHVTEEVWNKAHALTRFEQMPQWLQQRVLDEYPPVNRASALKIEDLRQRINKLDKQIGDAVSEVQLVKADNNGYVIRCKVDGSASPDFRLSAEQLDFTRTFLPGMKADTLMKQQLAGYLQQDIFRDNSRSLKR